MPWNYIDIILDPDSHATIVSDYRCGPGDFATKEEAAAAFRVSLHGLYKKYRGTAIAPELKTVRNAWKKRKGDVTRSNNLVLAVYEHPKGKAQAYAAMMSLLVNRLYRVNRLGLLAGHVSFWAIGELLKRYPDIRELCGKLETSH